MAFFTETENKNLKIHMEPQKTLKSWHNLEPTTQLKKKTNKKHKQNTMLEAAHTWISKYIIELW